MKFHIISDSKDTMTVAFVGVNSRMFVIAGKPELMWKKLTRLRDRIKTI